MKPDVATVLVNKMLKCPKNGMPEAFYIEGRIPKSLSKRDTHIFGISKTVVARVIIPTLAVGATWGLKILLEGTSTQSTGSFSQGKKGKYLKTGKMIRRVPKKTTKNVNGRKLKGKTRAAANKKSFGAISKVHDSTEQRNKRKNDERLTASTSNSTLMRKDAMEISENVPNRTNDKDNVSLRGLRQTAKDLDKTWLDRVITSTLEKLDEFFKRPF